MRDDAYTPETLKRRLARRPVLLAPGIYDALTASLATDAGAEALYLSGAAVAYTRLGQPDVGLVSILGVVEAIRSAQIETALTFNYTPYVVAAILFLLFTIPLTRFTDRVLVRSIDRQNAQGAA